MPLYKNTSSPTERLLYVLCLVAPKLFLPGGKSGLSIEPEVIRTADAGDLRQIQAAVGAYESQLSVCYTNMDTFNQQSASYAATLDVGCIYAERYWRLIRSA